jgi:hypothetical protein
MQSEKQLLEMALELLAVATYHSPELQARRTEVINAGLAAIRARLEQPEQDVARYCCHSCFKASGGVMLDRMILCSECGNKRCQKASDHNFSCTGSNEPGQWGSIYTTPPAATVQEPVVWAGWHTSTDDMMLFKTKAEAVSWRDQYKKGFASIEGLVRPFLPAAPNVDSTRVQEPTVAVQPMTVPLGKYTFTEVKDQFGIMIDETLITVQNCEGGPPYCPQCLREYETTPPNVATPLGITAPEQKGN